uniref:Protein-glutamate methylesterase/protein-glutamine glutaminase n=1 Tax=Candidatus Methanophaga sp. ANME-1 ERB7 TaxID=2759913 RepID=A0A7G9ZCD7_9EURY|nr:protein-glutamate methylesterase/protein-glutamine glutaminase [Methanosarcinales archaeon ANME-1 ERB7]
MAEANIMIVEDEVLFAKDLKDLLESWGYTVPALVSTGEEAIEKAGEMKPDLVLMDIVLKGGMDGIESADLIRTRFKIPVVYLTAYADDETVQRAKITEPYGYVLKPLEERDLHVTLEIALYMYAKYGVRTKEN